jgi:hypothetical protein
MEGASAERGHGHSPLAAFSYVPRTRSDWLRDNLEDASWAARCKRMMVHLRDEGVFVSTEVIQYNFAEVEAETLSRLPLRTAMLV